MEKIYQVFMGKFAKDFNDLSDKLNYIKWMGFDSVLLSPIFKAGSYHKYDTIDYMTIDEDFGALDDFKYFVSRCEELDLDIYLDIVVCHTSTKHQWYKDSREGKNDYYIWSDKLPDRKYWYPTPMHDCSWQQDRLTGGWRISPWGYNMPSLNIHSQELRKEIKEILTYWLNFSNRINLRLDAILYADLIYAQATEYCRWIRSVVEEINPHARIIGEVWTDDNVVKEFANALGSCFSFDDAAMIKNCANNNLPYYQVGKDNLVYFISNHDQTRLSNCLDNDINKIKKAFDMLYSTKGKAVVTYYGDEIGMQGVANGLDHTEVRRHMDWNEVKRQINDKDSLLNHIRNLNCK